VIPSLALGLEAEPRRGRPVVLDASTSVATAFSVITAECQDHWRANEAPLLGSRAMPHLHQLRVGLRRFRSSVSLLGPHLSSTRELVDATHELRELALSFGTARDLDVLLSGPLVADLTPSQVERLWVAREDAYDVVLSVLTSPVWLGVTGRLDHLLEDAPWAGLEDAPLRHVAASALDHRHGRVTCATGHVLAMTPAQRHRVRIEAKKLRYGSEFFATVFPSRTPVAVLADGTTATGPLALARFVEAVQSSLGALNDHATAEALLRSVGSHAPAVRETALVGAAEDTLADLTAQPRPWS
jgi:CHAD domain-containing protein